VQYSYARVCPSEFHARPEQLKVHRDRPTSEHRATGTWAREMTARVNILSLNNNSSSQHIAHNTIIVSSYAIQFSGSTRPEAVIMFLWEYPRPPDPM